MTSLIGRWRHWWFRVSLAVHSGLTFLFWGNFVGTVCLPEFGLPWSRWTDHCAIGGERSHLCLRPQWSEYLHNWHSIWMVSWAFFGMAFTGRQGQPEMPTGHFGRPTHGHRYRTLSRALAPPPPTVLTIPRHSSRPNQACTLLFIRSGWSFPIVKMFSG